MRSHLIHKSLTPVRNRYMLCQLVSKATRKFHRPNTRIQETMNEVLARVSKAGDPQSVIVVSSDKVAEQHRKAA